MKTQFSIITYFDPYGDMKSTRRQGARVNYFSEKTLDEIEAIINAYNNGKYYNAAEVSSFDNRSKSINNFDTSFYLTSKASAARYEDIPGL